MLIIGTSPLYSKIKAYIQNETLEPAMVWGLRMAIVSIIPIIWGVKMGQVDAAQWIALTAECICWVELKGSFGQSARILIGGAFLALLFGLLGAISSGSFLFSLLGILIVSFIASLFKNLGDRGSGLAITVFVIFLVANAQANTTTADVFIKMKWIAIGGAWNAFVGIISTLFRPARAPYRRSIFEIWKTVSEQVELVAKGWMPQTVKSNSRTIYLKELEIKSSIENSLQLYENLVHQINIKSGTEFELAQVRRSAALTATYISAIFEELENLYREPTKEIFAEKCGAALKAMQLLLERMAIYTLTLKTEEAFLVKSRLDKCTSSLQLLKEIKNKNPLIDLPVKNLILKYERIIKLVNSAYERLQKLNDQPVYQSYSLIKTVLILHPKHWWRNLKVLFHMNSQTLKYALRTTFGATIGFVIYKYFNTPHGLWLPFTTLMISQPFFGATFKKATDRVMGTVLGVIIGSLFLQLPAHLHLKEIILFCTSILMVLNIRKRYAIATFFITLNLVLLFSVAQELDSHFLYLRLAYTLGGALIAVAVGFLLLPVWDKKYLPQHIAIALFTNYQYFLASFYQDESKPIHWIKYKRTTETANSNAFDSFNRFAHEPKIDRSLLALYYRLITHIMRVTKELNSIHLEIENTKKPPSLPSKQVQALVTESLFYFDKIINQLAYLKPNITTLKMNTHLPISLNKQQQYSAEKIVIELMAITDKLETLINFKPNT